MLRRLAGMSRLLAAAFAAFVLIVAACGDASVSTRPSEPPQALDPTGAWQLTAGTVDGQPLALVADAPVTFVVDGSNVSGRSACNQYFGQFALVDGRVTLGGLGGTEMACDEPIMRLEGAYLAGLAKVDAARMDGEALVLTGRGTELRFERA
jgi:heat shock protein HslJ